MIKSLKNAWFGLRYAWATQRNLRIQVVILILVIIAGFVFGISEVEWFFVLSAGFMVIGAEMINTSVERLVDFAEQKRNINCKLIKDIAAGFVIVICVYAVTVGGIVFLPKLIALL
jgi:diacylglycerol kinase